MVWLGFGVGIINISRGDKFFFHFFEKFLNGLAGPLVPVWLVLVAGFVLDYPFWRVLEDKDRSLRGNCRWPGVSLYILYISTPLPTPV